MYLYIKPLACLLSHYFLNVPFSLSLLSCLPCLYDTVHITACYHLYDHFHFASVWLHFAYICLSSLSSDITPPLYFVRSISLSLSLSLSILASIYLSDLSIFIHFRAPWPRSRWYVQEMSRQRFLRRFIPLEIAPRARISRWVSVHIFIKIVEYMFVHK